MTKNVRLFFPARICLATAWMISGELRKRWKFTNTRTAELFGFAKAFLLTLNPDNSLVKSAQGHRVDESDIGALLRKANLLQKHGESTVLGEEKVGERQTLLVNVEAEKDFALEGTHRFLLNLDETAWLPLKVRSYDTAGNLREEVLMDDLETNVRLDDALFKP